MSSARFLISQSKSAISLCRFSISCVHQPGSAHGDTPGTVRFFRRDCKHARVQVQSNTNMPVYIQYQKVRHAHRRGDHSLFLVSHCSQIIHPACAHLSFKNNGTRTRAHADRHTHTHNMHFLDSKCRCMYAEAKKCPCVSAGAYLVGTN